MNNPNVPLPNFKKITSVHYSPWSEMIHSLHVLQRPDHHPFRVQWAQELAERMTPELRSELTELSRSSDQWFPFLSLEYGLEHGFRSAEAGIATLAKLPDAEFVHMALNAEFPISSIIEALRGGSSHRPITLRDDARIALLTHPAQMRRRFCEFLRAYSELIFEAEWERIVPWLVRADKTFRNRLDHNPADALGKLHPRLFVRNQSIEAQKTTLYTFPYEDIRRIVVRASTFVYPHLLIDWQYGVLTLPLAVDVPHLSKSDAVPPDLVRIFKALAEPTRLRIVRLLHAQPHCTQQLAPALGITEAAVSKHLKLLSEAGCIAAERNGNFVFYSLRMDETEMMMVYLRQFLEQ